MIFSSTFSKIGRGEHISTFMPEKNKISLYYYNSNVGLKNINTTDSRITLTKSNKTFPYHKIIQISNTLLVSRLGKSIRIFENE